MTKLTNDMYKGNIICIYCLSHITQAFSNVIMFVY